MSKKDKNKTDGQHEAKLPVLRSYAVSLVYQKNNVSDLETALRSKIVEAYSKEEAVGKLIAEIKDSDKLQGYLLGLKTVLLIA